MCISVNRDVTVDVPGTHGSKVLSVNKMDSDTYVTYGVDVISVIGAKAPPEQPPAQPRTPERNQGPMLRSDPP